MKMRKSTWLLLVLALAAILLVAGCSPTTPPNGEEPNGEEPTPPPAGGCPTKMETVVTSLYCGTGVTGKADFSILISFDKDIVLLDNNKDHWEVKVDRYVPYKKDGKSTTYKFKEPVKADIVEVTQPGSKLVKITATFKDPEVGFYGLICSQDCYEAFVDVLAPDGGYADKAYADKITWEYKGGNYPYADILGNPCPDCTIKGEACCQACEECVPEPGCPIGTICK